MASTIKITRSVNLTKRVMTEKGLRYVPVEYDEKGDVLPDGREGSYYLEWRENGKRISCRICYVSHVNNSTVFHGTTPASCRIRKTGLTAQVPLSASQP